MFDKSSKYTYFCLHDLLFWVLRGLKSFMILSICKKNVELCSELLGYHVFLFSNLIVNESFSAPRSKRKKKSYGIDLADNPQHLLENRVKTNEKSNSKIVHLDASLPLPPFGTSLSLYYTYSLRSSLATIK